MCTLQCLCLFEQLIVIKHIYIYYIGGVSNTYDYKTPLWAPLPILHITTMIVIILSWSFTGQNLYSQLGPRSPAAWAEVSGPQRPGPRSLGRGLRGPTSPYTNAKTTARTVKRQLRIDIVISMLGYTGLGYQ